MQVKRPSDRAFGITLAILFALTFIVFYYIFDISLIWAPWVSVIFVLIALLAPGVLMPLNLPLYQLFQRQQQQPDPQRSVSFVEEPYEEDEGTSGLESATWNRG